MKRFLQKFSAFVIVAMIFIIPVFLGGVVRAQDLGQDLPTSLPSTPSNVPAFSADAPSNTGGGNTNYLNPQTSPSMSPENTGVNNVNYSDPNSSTNNTSLGNFGGVSGYGGVAGATGLRNPVNANSLPQLLDLALKAVVDIGAVIGVLAIVYCGFLFLKAQGNSEELETAKRAFYWTLIGLAILLAASVLETILKNTISSLGAGV